MIACSLVIGMGLQCRTQASSNNTQFILTQTIDHEIRLYPFFDTSRFIISSDETFIINNIESHNIEIDLKNLSAFGIICRDQTTSNIDEMISNDRLEQWYVFSIDGVLLFSGSANSIPYESFQKGHVYIIKVQNKTYKYISL